jgi:serpin B
MDEERVPGEVLRSQETRISSPDVEPDELAELVAGNNAFALDLYRDLGDDADKDNLLYSPYSISQALAMTYAGARSTTAQQMSETLHFTLPQERLHPAFNALDQALTTRAQQQEEDQEGTRFQLNIANALWGQQGYSFLSEYLDILARHYGAGLQLMDFRAAPEQARQDINAWVSEQTEEKIQDLLPPGAVDTLTRLVLTNAIYFNASWKYPFKEDATQDAPFFLLSGAEISVPTMRQVETLGYAAGENYEVIELPYAGDTMSMLILLPDAGTFAAFEAALDLSRLNTLVEAVASERIALTLPKFSFDARFQLSNTLAEMGMPAAFSPQEADFSGMAGNRDLYIQDILHKAFIAVDEAGTEAAAATGVVIGVTSAPADPREVTVDHPFIFIIRDNTSGALLFVGRVTNPRAGQ